MVASFPTRSPLVETEGPPEPSETATYIYLLARELESMARVAGLDEVGDSLAEAGRRTAAALKRMSQA